MWIVINSNGRVISEHQKKHIAVKEAVGNRYNKKMKHLKAGSLLRKIREKTYNKWVPNPTYKQQIPSDMWGVMIVDKHQYVKKLVTEEISSYCMLFEIPDNYTRIQKQTYIDLYKQKLRELTEIILV